MWHCILLLWKVLQFFTYNSQRKLHHRDPMKELSSAPFSLRALENEWTLRGIKAYGELLNSVRRSNCLAAITDRYANNCPLVLTFNYPELSQRGTRRSSYRATI